MRTLVLTVILVKSLTGAERVQIEHLAGGNSVFIKDVKGSGSTQIYRTVKPSQQGSQLLLTHHRRDLVSTIPQDARVVAPREKNRLLCQKCHEQ